MKCFPKAAGQFEEAASRGFSPVPIIQRPAATDRPLGEGVSKWLT